MRHDWVTQEGTRPLRQMKHKKLKLREATTQQKRVRAVIRLLLLLLRCQEGGGAFSAPSEINVRLGSLHLPSNIRFSCACLRSGVCACAGMRARADV